MQRSFALTTKQAARLRKVQPHVLYAGFNRHGAWEGVVPTKLANGRLLWPRDEILRADGLVQLHGAAGSDTVDVRSFLACLDALGLPADDAALCALGARLLSQQEDRGRDPAYMLDEMKFLADACEAASDRLDRSFAAMTPSDRTSAKRLARYMAQTWAWLSDEAAGKGDRNAAL